MPLYEYHCSSCNQNVELLQKFSDPPTTECPNCHQPTLARQISATSFQLKGSGWYVTDFRNKDKPKDSSGGGGSSAE
jgi:putative FmdB family regulatory protein